MKIITLASGSKGNCTYIGTDQTHILLDIGISILETEKKLKAIGVEPKTINAIIVTHEHSDHIKSVGAFAQKYNVPIIAHEKEWKILESKLPNLEVAQKVSFLKPAFLINDIKVNAIPLSHDSYTCFGYSFYKGNNKVSVVTDLGYAPEEVINSIMGSNIVVLEANHDEKLLMNNPKYTLALKKRILSKKGHLSNLASAEIIKRLAMGGTKQIVLAHLSENNNTPSIAYNTIRNELYKYGIVEGENIFIDVATQHEIGNMFNIKDE